MYSLDDCYIEKSRGFSLIELMVAMVIGLFVAAIVATMYVSIIRANSTTVQMARLNQDLQAALDIVASDVQRAGYVSGAESILARDSAGNPTINVASSAVGIAMFNSTTDMSGSTCISLRYDSNGNSTLDTASSSLPEYISYRVSGQILQYASAACSSTTWTNLIGGDNYSNITALSFTLSPSAGISTSGAYPTTGHRYIRIQISGNNAKNNDVHLSLDRIVRLQNDQF